MFIKNIYLQIGPYIATNKQTNGKQNNKNTKIL